MRNGGRGAAGGPGARSQNVLIEGARGQGSARAPGPRAGLAAVGNLAPPAWGRATLGRTVLRSRWLGLGRHPSPPGISTVGLAQPLHHPQTPLSTGPSWGDPWALGLH